MSSSGGVVSDMNRFVKVRGVVLGPDGCPQGKEIHPNYAIHSTLMAGRCPIGKGTNAWGICSFQYDADAA